MQEVSNDVSFGEGVTLMFIRFARILKNRRSEDKGKSGVVLFDP